jgi:ATP-binding cassette subfamily B multidrug efflux pump
LQSEEGGIQFSSMGQIPFKKVKKPERLISYWGAQLPLCLLITLTGFLYNFGMLVSPYFEGRIVDSVEAKQSLQDILILLGIFIGAILVVLLARIAKRYTVRRFANNTSVTMRLILENNLLHQDQGLGDSTGSTLSKVISDVTATVEGMRKLTTEIFDTVIMFIFYIAYLFLFDVTMTLYVLIPVFVAVLVAFLMRKAIFSASSQARKANGKMTASTYDLFDNAITYRIYGRDQDHLKDYDGLLADYEKKNVRASALTDMMIPLANIIALIGLVPLFIMGPAKVASGSALSAPIPGIMNSTWTLGAFTSYLTTFVLMASKASKTAKLFGSIEKGLASWKRIKPIIKPYAPYAQPVTVAQNDELVLKDFSLTIEGKTLISHLDLTAKRGQIIGITGPIASGKSAFTKVFSQTLPYEGSVSLFGKELSAYSPAELAGTIVTMPHKSELFTDTIEHNISLGGEAPVAPYLEKVSFAKDLQSMPLKEQTLVGNEGVKLSGGQQERLCLARTLYERKPLLILDDPFASVDPKTEAEIVANLRVDAGDSLVLLVSHRLSCFSQLDQVIVLSPEEGVQVGTHASLLETSSLYHSLYALQQTGGENHE